MNEHPWRTMWLQPRATVRAIIEENPNRSLWMLAFLFGLDFLLSRIAFTLIAQTSTLFAVLLVVLLLAPLCGYLIFAIWSWLALYTGRMLKGQATFKELRAAQAWSCVPLSISVLIWLVLVLFYSPVLFFGPEKLSSLSQGSFYVLHALFILKIACEIWALVLYCLALAEVQRFSVLRSIGNILLTGIANFILLNLIAFILGLIVYAVSPH